jgi:hypothetical protein
MKNLPIPDEIPKHEFDKAIADLKLLVGISSIDVRDHHLHHLVPLIDALANWIPYSVTEEKIETLYRISVNKNILGSNKRISDIKYLKYPPKQLVKKFGRCNQPNESVFYCSFMGFTSMMELKPRVGDLITETKWKLKVDRNLHFVPIFYNQPTNKPFINRETGELIDHLFNPTSDYFQNRFEEAIESYPPLLKELSIETMKTISNFFARYVDSGNHLNYIFSSIFASKFFNDVPDSDKIDAIMYPSVQSRLNEHNLAIKPECFEDFYELEEVNEQVVVQDPSNGKGGYFSQATGIVRHFDFVTGKILWDTASGQDKERNLELSKIFGIDLSY